MNADPMQSTSLSLLERARSNDQTAWRQLVHLYGPLVQRWCKRAGLNDEDTSDVFQESFRSLAGHLDSFAPARSTGSFRSWLRTIVRTRVADHYRRQQKQPRAAGGTDAQLAMAGVADPIDEETEDQMADDHSLLVRRAMELIQPEFSERNWRAFEQVALEGKNAVEVAEQLNVAPQAVRQANYRIRRRLRLVLEGLAENVE